MDEDCAAFEAEIKALLSKIGWDASNLKQIEVYARMSPAQKVGQMLHIRRQYVEILEAHLRREHPDATRFEMAMLLQAQLDLVREYPRHG